MFQCSLQGEKISASQILTIRKVLINISIIFSSAVRTEQKKHYFLLNGKQKTRKKGKSFNVYLISLFNSRALETLTMLGLNRHAIFDQKYSQIDE